MSRSEWLNIGKTAQWNLRPKAPKALRFDLAARAEVWVYQDEIESDSRYEAIVKAAATDDQKIDSLKELARQIAQETLANGCQNKQVQISAEISPTDANADSIDWVTLVSPEITQQANAQKSIQKIAIDKQPINPVQMRQQINTTVPEVSGYGASKPQLDAITNFVQDYANKGPAAQSKLQNFMKQHAVPPAKPPGVQPPPKPSVDPSKVPSAPATSSASGIGSGSV